MQLLIVLIQNKCSPIPMNVQAQLNYSHGYFYKLWADSQKVPTLVIGKSYNKKTIKLKLQQVSH